MFTHLMRQWLQQLRRPQFGGKPRRRRSTQGSGRSEILEPRSVLSASISGAATASASHSLSEIPRLTSNPNAFAKLYLDFDGNFESEWSGRRNVVSPVFSLDADPTTFNDWELATIRETTLRRPLHSDSKFPSKSK